MVKPTRFKPNFIAGAQIDGSDIPRPTTLLPVKTWSGTAYEWPGAATGPDTAEVILFIGPSDPKTATGGRNQTDDLWVDSDEGPSSVSKVKPADTTRASNTTLSDDPDLFGIPLEAGARYEGTLRLFIHAASPGYIKFALVSSGTAAIDAIVRHYHKATDVTSGTWGTDFVFDVTDAAHVGRDINNVALSLSIGSAYRMFLIDFAIEVTNAGTFSFQWAQVASNATGATVRDRSSLRLAKVG